MPANLRAERPYNNDATTLLTGDIQIPIVVADDTTFVEHPGKRRAPPRRRQPAHRPFAPALGLVKVVLASLRALHLDQRLRPGAPRAKRALTTGTHTGNAGSPTLPIVVEGCSVRDRPNGAFPSGPTGPRSMWTRVVYAFEYG
jgi:hypothetical protein